MGPPKSLGDDANAGPLSGNGDENGNHEQQTSQDEEIIEIDYDMIGGAKAQRVKHLYINERFMKSGVGVSQHQEGRLLAARELKTIFQDISTHLERNVEQLTIDLTIHQIYGSILAPAVMKNLTSLHVQSGLVLLHQDDRTALGKVIYEHELLGEIRLHNLVVKERLLNRFNKNPAPPLDVLVPAFNSITFLNVLELSCSPTMEELSATTGDALTSRMMGGITQLVPTSKPMLSLLAVRELLNTLTLQRLELTRLGLTDDHYSVLVEQLSEPMGTSCLTELILNENKHTDTGLDMLASLLFKKGCPLTSVESYQSNSAVIATTLEYYEQALRENTTIQTLRIHLWGEEDDLEESLRTNHHKSRIPFFLKLNRHGRKRLLDRQATHTQWYDLITQVSHDPSELYYCLRNSGFWWRCWNMPIERPADFRTMPATSSLSSPSIISLRNDDESPTSPLGMHSPTQRATKRRPSSSARRLKQLKGKHRELLEGLNLTDHDDNNKDNLSEIGEDDDDDHASSEKSDSSLAKELLEKKLPRELSLDLTAAASAGDDEDFDFLQNSVISMGAGSYIQDLVNQKQKRPREAREEVLEEALEEVDYAVNHDKLPPGMSKEYYFHRVLERLSREKAKEEIKLGKKLDTLLENVLIKEAAKELAAKQKVAASSNGKKLTGEKGEK